MHLEVYTTSYPLICLWIKSVTYVTIWGFLIVFTFVLGLYQVKTHWEVFHIRSRIFRESSLKHVKPKLNFKSHFLWHAWLQSKWCFLGSNFQEIGLPQKKKKRKKKSLDLNLWDRKCQMFHCDGALLSKQWKFTSWLNYNCIFGSGGSHSGYLE